MSFTIDNTISIPEFRISLSMKKRATELYQITTSADVAVYAKSLFDADNVDWVESFFVIMLNRCNRVLGFFKVSSGGLCGTVADPRVIFQAALLSNACQIIVTHNHPSGNLRPSRQDEELTRRLKEAGNFLEIKVLDHIIVGSGGFYSFADEGIL